MEKRDASFRLFVASGTIMLQAPPVGLAGMLVSTYWADRPEGAGTPDLFEDFAGVISYQPTICEEVRKGLQHALKQLDRLEAGAASRSN